MGIVAGSEFTTAAFHESGAGASTRSHERIAVKRNPKEVAIQKVHKMVKTPCHGYL